MADQQTSLLLDAALESGKTGVVAGPYLDISIVELEKFFRNVPRPLIVTLLTCTEPNLRKTNNPYFGRVQKYSRVNGVVGFNYERAVNSQRQREADPQTVEEAEAVPTFHALPRKWGQRIWGTALVEHKDNLYVEIKVERKIEHFYVVDGKLADDKQFAEIESFLQKKLPNVRQEVEREVELRDYKLENVRAVRVAGKQFNVV